MVDSSSVPSLVPLFATYCGGAARESQLIAALQLLTEGQLRGKRALNDGGGHYFELRWSGEPAPLANLSCELRFPDHPSIQYDFQVPCHQLVSWLIESTGKGLPEGFWPWLLQGRAA